MSESGQRQITTWQIAEENAAEWMRSWGYSNVELTRAGADAGVDIRADGAIAQVKFEAAQVGRPALQRLMGARGADHQLAMLFFSGAGYSRTALSYAREVGIGLFVYALDGGMVAVNDRASELADLGGQALEPTSSQLKEKESLEEFERARLEDREKDRLNGLWSTYRQNVADWERSGSRADLAEHYFRRDDSLAGEDLPDWWIVPPPANWRDNNPDREARQRELEFRQRLHWEREFREEEYRKQREKREEDFRKFQQRQDQRQREFREESERRRREAEILEQELEEQRRERQLQEQDHQKRICEKRQHDTEETQKQIDRALRAQGYRFLWTSYEILSSRWEESRHGVSRLFRRELRKLYQEEELAFEYDIPEWWIVPPPKSWRESRPEG